MAAVYVSNIVINSGSDFSQVFTLDSSDTNTPLDLSLYEVKSQLRKHAGSSSYVDFITEKINPLNGVIELKLPANISASLKPGRYVYDIVIISSNLTKERIIEGMVLVREGVTK